MKKTTHGWVQLCSAIFLVGMGVYTLFAPNLLINGSGVMFGLMLILLGIADWMLYTRLGSSASGRVWTLISGIGNIGIGALLLFGVGNAAGGISIWFLIAVLLHNLGRFMVKGALGDIAGDGQKNITLWTNLLCAICFVIPFFAPLSTAWVVIGLALIAVDNFVLSSSPACTEAVAKKAVAAS